MLFQLDFILAAQAEVCCGDVAGHGIKSVSGSHQDQFHTAEDEPNTLHEDHVSLRSATNTMQGRGS